MKERTTQLLLAVIAPLAHLVRPAAEAQRILRPRGRVRG